MHFHSESLLAKVQHGTVQKWVVDGSWQVGSSSLGLQRLLRCALPIAAGCLLPARMTGTCSEPVTHVTFRVSRAIGRPRLVVVERMCLLAGTFDFLQPIQITANPCRSARKLWGRSNVSVLFKLQKLNLKLPLHSYLLNHWLKWRGLSGQPHLCKGMYPPSLILTCSIYIYTYVWYISWYTRRICSIFYQCLDGFPFGHHKTRFMFLPQSGWNFVDAATQTNVMLRIMPFNHLCS